MDQYIILYVYVYDDTRNLKCLTEKGEESGWEDFNNPSSIYPRANAEADSEQPNSSDHQPPTSSKSVTSSPASRPAQTEDVCRSAHQLTEDSHNLEQTHKKRSHTAQRKVQRKRVKDYVRIQTEKGPSLQICPEKRYSEDFEPY